MLNRKTFQRAATIVLAAASFTVAAAPAANAKPIKNPGAWPGQYRAVSPGSSTFKL